MISSLPLKAEIRSLRKALKLTQSEFAMEVGVEQATVSRWEKGAEPSLDNLTAIMDLAEKNHVPIHGIANASGNVLRNNGHGQGQAIEVIGRINEDCSISLTSELAEKTGGKIVHPEIPPGSVTLFVWTNQFLPIITRSSHIVFGPEIIPDENHWESLVIAKDHESRHAFGRLYPGRSSKLYHLLSPIGLIEDVRVATVRQAISVKL